MVPVSTRSTFWFVFGWFLWCALPFVLLFAAPVVLPGALSEHGKGHELYATGWGLALRVDYWLWQRILEHPVIPGALFLTAFIFFVQAMARRRQRQAHRDIRRATGVARDEAALTFPMKPFDLFKEISRRPQGHTFVGMTPVARRVLPGFLGPAWKPVYLSPRERSMHRHVLGKTGSGKTSSILWPQVLQDALEGRGVLGMDAKGSDENAATVRWIAAASKRQAQLRHFNLAALSDRRVFSHTYNMVHVRPPSRPGTRDGDIRDTRGAVGAMVERVFGVLGLSAEPYYRAQALFAFGRLCRLLHGMRDEHGDGLPFTLTDVAIALRGLVSNTPGSESANPWKKALTWCLKHSTDREAAEELNAALASKADKLEKDLAGLVAALDQFQSPLVNAYAPDITFEEVMEKNLLVYAQLPSNLHKIQAPALGRVMLADVQQETAQRQVNRRKRNQTPFSVNIDEFGTFADMSIVDTLNKARDANVWLTLSHQSFADLDIANEKLGPAVWDNTRTKDILVQDDPEVCERMAKSLGTRPDIEHTIQQGPDVMGTVAATGTISTRAVDKYILHPNALKALLPCGQGYLFATRHGGRVAVPTVYGPLPKACRLDYELPRNSQSKARGLRLRERFIVTRPAQVSDAPLDGPRALPSPQRAPTPAPIRNPARKRAPEPNPATNATSTRNRVPVPAPAHRPAAEPPESRSTRSILALPPPPPTASEHDARSDASRADTERTSVRRLVPSGDDPQRSRREKHEHDEKNNPHSRPTVAMPPVKKKVGSE